MTIKLILLGAIGFFIVLALGGRSPDTLALLVVLLIFVVMGIVKLIPTTLRLIILAAVGFGLASAGQSSAILFGLGMAFAVVMLCLIPAPWFGYDDLFVYQWFERSDDESGEGGWDEGDGGDGGGGD